MRSVVTHNEQFSVWLGRIRVRHFIFKPHPRTGECDVLTIWGPRHMRIIAVSRCQAFDGTSIGLDRVDLVRSVYQTREHDQVTARRPERKIIILAGERGDGSRIRVHDSEAMTVFL